MVIAPYFQSVMAMLFFLLRSASAFMPINYTSVTLTALHDPVVTSGNR